MAFDALSQEQCFLRGSLCTQLLGVCVCVHVCVFVWACMHALFYVQSLLLLTSPPLIPADLSRHAVEGVDTRHTLT